MAKEMKTSGKEKKAAPEPKQQSEKGKRTGSIVRMAETNLNGKKPVFIAIQGIRGVGQMFSHAIDEISGLGNKIVEELSPEEMAALEDMIANPGKHGIPTWMFNRKNDPKSGETKHLSASTLDFTTRMDINAMKKLKTYRGLRHSQGLPVRGQRTRSSFRKGKTVGVKRQKQAPSKSKSKK